MPNTPGPHELFSNVNFDNLNSENHAQQKKDVIKYFKSKNFTPQSYVDLMSGNYHPEESDASFHGDDLASALEMLKKHPHNNEANNDRVADNLLESLKASKDDFWAKDRLYSAMKHLRFSPEKIHDIIDEYDTVGKNSISNISLNPSFNREHLASIINKPTIPISYDMLNHPAMDQQLFDKMMQKKGYDTSKLPSEYADSIFFNAEHANKVLDRPGNDASVDSSLEKLTPEARHKKLNDMLGISGGKPAQGKEAFEYPENFGWDNWENGDKYHENHALDAASSKFLTPDQIDHIKRHGSFKQKYALFNNESIDLKHHLEMLRKWGDDDSEHGYDSHYIKQALTKEHEDNKWDDFSDEAREEEQDAYPMSEYLENWNDDDLSNAYFNQPAKEWKDNWIQQHIPPEQRTVKNPDYDPTLPEDATNPKTIEEENIEDHPDYSKLEEQADQAFKQAIENAPETPEDVYEGYDNALHDEIYRNVQRKFDDEVDNWSSSEYLLPKHIAKAIKAPWKDDKNITPEQLQAGLDHPFKMVRDTAASNENLPPELISKVLSGDYDNDMKMAVLNNAKNLQPDHISQAIASGDSDLAIAALQSPKAKAEHIASAIEKYPDHGDVIREALDSPMANDDHAKAVIQQAGENGGFSPGLHAAVDSKFNLSPAILQSVYDANKHFPQANSSHVLQRVISHPNTPPMLINRAINSPHPFVKKTAQNVQQRRFPPTADPVNVKTGTHPFRILRDFIDQHGGTISKAKMKELGANTSPIDKLFSPKGTISSKDIQNYIDQMPATPYNSSHSTWSSMQRHSGKVQDVFQLNYTQDQVNQMEKEGVMPTFHKIHEATFSSGHPVRPNTLGWVRYTGNPETGFHIDEVQSDFGQSMIKKVAAQAKEALQNGSADQDQVEEAMKRAKEYYPEEHVDKITKILFGNKHPSEVIHEAFKEYMRGKGFGDTPIHIWQPQGKAPLSGQETHTRIEGGQAKKHLNRAIAGDVSHEAKALIAWGQKNKIIPGSHKDIKPEHLNALADAYVNHIEDRRKNPKMIMDTVGSGSNAEDPIPTLPVPLPVHMQEGYGAIPKKMKYQEATYGELPTQDNPKLQGQPTYKETVRKSEVDASTRTKVATTLQAIKQNGQVWEQIKGSNPQAYDALMKLVQSLVDVFKKKSGEDPNAVIHELEIQQQLEEQQAQESQSGPEGQPQQESQASQPAQDQPIHRQKTIYGTGAIRRYNSQDERIKDQDGNWQSFNGGLQDPGGGTSD